MRKSNKTINQVETILQKYPQTRDDDVLLWSTLVADYYPLPERIPVNWYEVATIIARTPSMDYIAKCRRNIIEKYKFKKFLPTTSSIASFRGIDKVLYERYAKANPSEVEIEPIVSNYPSHLTPSEIDQLDI